MIRFPLIWVTLLFTLGIGVGSVCPQWEVGYLIATLLVLVAATLYKPLRHSVLPIVLFWFLIGATRISITLSSSSDQQTEERECREQRGQERGQREPMGIERGQRELLSQERGQRELMDRERRLLMGRWYSSGLSAESQGFLSALLLGRRDLISPSTRHDFSMAGASHLLALSGLHMGILYGLLYLLLIRWVRHTPNRWFALPPTLLLIWGYTLLAGLPTSLIRASLMLSLLTITTLAIPNTPHHSHHNLPCNNPSDHDNPSGRNNLPCDNPSDHHNLPCDNPSDYNNPSDRNNPSDHNNRACNDWAFNEPSPYIPSTAGGEAATLNILMLAALIMLALDPLCLFDISFQLSYVAVLFILLLRIPLLQLFQTLLFLASDLPLRLLHSLFPSRFWYNPLRAYDSPRLIAPLHGVAQLLAVSLAAQIGTAPLTVYYFHTLPILSCLLGLALIPLTTLIIYLGLLLLLIPVHPLASLLNTMISTEHWMVTQWIELPHTVIQNLHPTQWEVAAAYFFLVVFAVRRSPTPD